MKTFTLLSSDRLREGRLHLISAKILKKLFQNPVSFEQRAPARSAGPGAPFTASVGCFCWLLELGPHTQSFCREKHLVMLKIEKVNPRSHIAASLYSKTTTRETCVHIFKADETTGLQFRPRSGNREHVRRRGRGEIPFHTLPTHLCTSS